MPRWRLPYYFHSASRYRKRPCTRAHLAVKQEQAPGCPWLSSIHSVQRKIARASTRLQHSKDLSLIHRERKSRNYCNARRNNDPDPALRIGQTARHRLGVVRRETRFSSWCVVVFVSKIIRLYGQYLRL